MQNTTILLVPALCLLIPASSCTKKSNKPAPAAIPAPTGPAVTPTPTPSTEGAAITYPVPDPELGESLQSGELDASKELPKVIEDQIKQMYANGKRALRDAHPKAHGCLNATFTVDPAIPDKYAHGVFSKGSSYKAIIRFSNSSENGAAPDIEKDGRGMATKLLGVPGTKLLENQANATTQDFIMISHPVFFIQDSTEYVNFIKTFMQTDILSKLATLKSLGAKGTAIASAIKSLQVPSAIQQEYFSNVPYQLGVGSKKLAVKYNARPCAINGKDDIPNGTKDDNYLRTRLREHFEKSDGCMDIYVQERTDDKMNVEDSRDEWKSPWTKIATLTMKKGEQDIAATPDPKLPQNIACDTLSFNPWHSLPEHKPLGSINRLRKVVYEHISKVRHEMNKEERKEPQ